METIVEQPITNNQPHKKEPMIIDTRFFNKIILQDWNKRDLKTILINGNGNGIESVGSIKLDTFDSNEEEENKKIMYNSTQGAMGGKRRSKKSRKNRKSFRNKK